MRGSEESVIGGVGKRNWYLEKFWIWIGDCLGLWMGFGVVLGGCLYVWCELLVGMIWIEDLGDGVFE